MRAKQKWHRVVRTYWVDVRQRHQESFVFKSLSAATCAHVAKLLNDLCESGDTYRVERARKG